LRWSVGVRLLSQADPESTNELPNESAEADPLLQPEESLPRGGIHRHESSCSCSTRFEGEPQNARRSPSTITEDTQRLRPPPPSRPAHFFYSFPNTPNPSQVRIGFDPTSVTTTTAVSVESTNGGTDFSDSDTDNEVPIELRTGLRSRRRRMMAEPTSTRFQSIVRRTRHRISRFWNALNDFMTVPLWAALASLIVACTQPLQHALEVHMPAVKSALGSAGNCSIPVTLIVLGAYFHSAPNPAQTNNEQNGVMITTKPEPTSSLMAKVKRFLNISRRGGVAKPRAGETRTVVISVLSRMVITPLLILPMMVLSTKFSLHSVFDE
jgi:auxin efflux carrier family protein